MTLGEFDFRTYFHASAVKLADHQQCFDDEIPVGKRGPIFSLSVFAGACQYMPHRKTGASRLSPTRPARRSVAYLIPIITDLQKKFKRLDRSRDLWSRFASNLTDLYKKFRIGAAAGSLSARLSKTKTRGQSGAYASGCCSPCSIFCVKIIIDEAIKFDPLSLSQFDMGPRHFEFRCASYKMSLRLFFIASTINGLCAGNKQTAYTARSSLYSSGEEGLLALHLE